jgi:two-component system, NarL family, nitrate/nitrite response regulator NarL
MVQDSADPISILLVDDHSLIIELIERFLSSDDRFLVSSARNLAGGIARIREARGFDVVLLDYDLPGISSIDDVVKVIEANPDGAVVLFSGSVPERLVEKAIRAGARGFIPKTMPLRALTSAVSIIAAGQTFIPHGMVFHDDRGFLIDETELTREEKAMLHDMSEGLAYKEIAFRLQMSLSNVKRRARMIYRKLGARNRTHAVNIGRAEGLL